MTGNILVTCGDVNGIGLRCLAQALTAEPLLASTITLVIDRSVLEQAQEVYSITLPVAIHSIYSPCTITPGIPSPTASRLALLSLERAFEIANQSGNAGITTLPVNKYALQSVGWKHPGQTEMAAAHSHGRPLMVMHHGALRIAINTVHIPLREVPTTITANDTAHNLQTLSDHLITDLRIQQPRIAVLGLNPHAGEHGAMGNEESELLLPAIQQAHNNGIRAEGPFPADGFFGFGAYEQYDAILAMYHDQGLIPAKLLSKGAGVNVTAGLNIVRTSPDHGTAYDSIGSNNIDSSSVSAALALCSTMMSNRLLLPLLCISFVCGLLLNTPSVAQPEISWKARSVKTALATMNAVAMRTSEIGIAVGESGVVRCYAGNNDAQPFPVLAYTTVETSGMNDMYGAAYSMTGTAVAVGDGGQIWRTTDDGHTWTKQVTLDMARLVAVAGDDSTFVAVGSDAIAVSLDDGKTWNVQHHPGSCNDVSGTVQNGWLTAGERVLYSPDLSGWTDVTPDTSITYKKTDIINSAEAPSGVLFGVVGDPFYMGSTGTLGKTWVRATLPDGLAEQYPRAETKCFSWKEGGIPAIWMIEDRYLPEEITLLSKDIAAGFTRQPTGDQIVSFVYNSIAYISMDRILGVGPEGQSHTVLYDNDLPRLWFSSDVDVSLYLKSIHTRDSLQLVVGNQSNVFASLSSSNGKRFRTIYDGPAGCNGVSGIISTDNSLLVMYDSVFVDHTAFPPDTKRMSCIMRSLDSGASWTVVFRHPNQLPSQKLSITHSGTVLAHTFGRWWYASTDNGSTWDSVSISADCYFQPACEVVSDSLWFANAYNSATQTYDLYVTTDAGHSWAKRTAVDWVTDYSFVNERNGFASCRVMSQGSPASDVIHSTTDGGSTWSELYRNEGGLGLTCLDVDTALHILVAMGMNAHSVVVPLDNPTQTVVDSSLKSYAMNSSPTRVLSVGNGTFIATGPYQSIFYGTVTQPVSSFRYATDGIVPLKLYPNPASHVLHVTCSRAIASVLFTSLGGFQYKPSFILHEGGIRINVSDIPQGGYILSVNGDGYSATAGLVNVLR